MHRDRRLPLAAALAVVVSVLAVGLAARAQGCEAESCMYLPAVQQGEGSTVQAVQTEIAPTVTQTPTEMPPPSGPTPAANYGCNNNAPLPANGVQAWINDPNAPPSALVAVCVRLAVNGRYVYGYPASAVVHWASRDVVLVYPGSTASVPGVTGFLVNPYDPDVLPDSTVGVDVAVTYLDRTYLTHTGFRPWATSGAVTSTPSPTNTPTITPTP